MRRRYRDQAADRIERRAVVQANLLQRFRQADAEIAGDQRQKRKGSLNGLNVTAFARSIDIGLL